MKTSISLPHVMTDNEARYIGLVAAVVNFSGPGSNIHTSPYEGGFNISVEPADPTQRDHLIKSLLGMHRGIGLKIIFSKSLAIQKLVSFKINFADKK